MESAGEPPCTAPPPRVTASPRLPPVVPVTAENAVILRYANGPLNRRKCLDFFLVQGLGVAQQIDLGQPLGGALNLVNPHGNTWQTCFTLTIGNTCRQGTARKAPVHKKETAC